MGFYNIYKIIKDMIRTLLGRKTLKAIILILLITIALLIVDKSTVQASDVVIGSNDTNINYIEYSFDTSFEYNSQSYNVHFNYYLAPDLIPDTSLQQVITRQYYSPNDYFNIYLWCPYSTVSANSALTYLYLDSNNARTRWYRSQISFSNLTPGNNTITLYLNNIYSFTQYTTAYTNINIQGDIPTGSTSNISNILYSSRDIYDSTYTDILFVSPYNITTKNPEIATSLADLQTLNFDVLSIDGWDYSTQDLYLLCYDRNSGYTESLTTLYPVNEILLNQRSEYFMREISADPTVNAIYWIPKDKIGFNWIPQGTYAFRFAIRIPIESEYVDWAYSYLTDYFSFTLDSSVTQTQIDDLNNNTKEKIEEQRHNETINSINNINDFLTDDSVNENEIDNNLNFNNNNEDITNTNTGFFSRLTTMVSDLVDYDLSEDEIIEIPVPFTTQKIILHSNMLYNTLPQALQLLFSMFWSYLFGMYLFRFVNKIYIAISTGNILDGFSSSGEVITNDML